MAAARDANRYVEDNAPWKLLKDRPRALRRRSCTRRSAVISGLKVALYPFLPFTCQTLHGYLGNEGPLSGRGLAVRAAASRGSRSRKRKPLFKKLDPVIVEEEEARTGRLMLVDSHCHLQDPKFARHERRGHPARSRRRRRRRWSCVGYDMPSSRRAVELADSHEDLYAVIGVHPHDAKTLTPQDIDELARLADSREGRRDRRDRPRLLPEPLAAGRAATGRSEEQLELARDAPRLPVVIHSRDADEQMLRDARASTSTQALPDVAEGPAARASCTASPVTCRSRCGTSSSASSSRLPATVHLPERRAAPAPWPAASRSAGWPSRRTRRTCRRSRSRGKRNEPAYVRETVAVHRGMPRRVGSTKSRTDRR